VPGAYRRAGIGERLGEIGEAVVGVVHAELEALHRKLVAWLGEAGAGVALIAAAGALVFWAVGALVAGAIALGGRWLPIWASAAIVCLLLLLVAAVLALLARARLRRLESPLALARHQLDSHLDWWRDQVLAGARPPSPSQPWPSEPETDAAPVPRGKGGSG
jgi:hypothetical protein